MGGRGINKSFYHYKVLNKVTGESNFYRTCKDITNEFGICRATIYNMINKPSTRTRKHNHLDITQMLHPINTS